MKGKGQQKSYFSNESKEIRVISSMQASNSYPQTLNEKKTRDEMKSYETESVSIHKP